MLLRVQGIILSWLRTLGIVMIGLFFNMFLPGLVGRDAVRLYFIFQCAPGRKTLSASLGFAIQASCGLLGAAVYLLSQKIPGR